MTNRLPAALRPAAVPVFVRFGLRRLAGAALALLASAALAAAPAGSTGSIEGRVQNVDTATYLNHARVRVANTTRETFTNEFGEYRFNDLPAGEAVLDVFFTGLRSKQLAVTVPAGGTVSQDVELSANDANRVVTLDRFVVQSAKETNAAAIAINEQRFAPNLKDVVSTDAFGDINQGNIGEFVKFIPGISLDVKDGNSPSGIMIRGFDPNYTTVLMDGGQLASTQIANTQTSSRGFLLEQANINNLSRIEISKEPTPDMPANSLGGTVNLISKNAFEYARRQLTFNAFLNANSQAMDFKKTPGPGRDETYKIRPNFDMTLVEPINRRLGFVVNFAQSDNYYIQYKAVPSRRYFLGSASNVNGIGVPGNGYVPLQTNPQTTAFQFGYNPNIIQRTSGSVRVDWKPVTRHVLTVVADASANYQQQAGHTLTYNTGSGNLVSWDEHNSYGSKGSSGTGSANMGNSFQNRNGLLRHIGARWSYTGVNWQWDVAGSYSNSNNRVRDTAKGFWNGVSTSLPGVKQVDLIGIDNSRATVQTTHVYDANGNPIDELNLANYTIGKLTSQPANNEDNMREARANISRSFTVLGNPLALKAGGSINNMTRDQQYVLWETNYAGPDGKLASGDETAAPFVNPREIGISPGFGRPGPQWPDPYLIYQASIDHPTWFVRNPSNYGDTIRNYATRSPWLHEKITAGYVMADAKLLRNRLRLVGGLRYELTEDEGQGYKQDGNAIYVQDAAGHPVKDSAGKYQLLPSLAGTASGGPEQTALIYQWRGAYNSRSYGYYFPSAHATFNITDNLLARFEFAETMGRPNISDIVPNVFVGDNINFGVSGASNSSIPGFITTNNSTLKPWTAKNYDYSLEYYVPHSEGGYLKVNWFKKDIRNFFSTVHYTADTALLDQLGLSHDYIGYDYQTRVNVADAMIKGWEASVNIPLSTLTQWGPLDALTPVAKHIAVFANTTHLDLFGSRITASDWKRYIPRSRNFGVRWSAWRFSGNLLLNWKGRMLRDTSTNITGGSLEGSEYIRARYQLDGNLDYQLSKHWGLFLAGRNILNSSTEWEVWGPKAVAYDSMTNYERYGVQWSLGVRGSF